ncbi:MAG: hypothetical protein JOZ38_03880, partial [Candidatus Eremiobacteraeota bacterium]|nr:hypothetical protein [Candidatus Eremiobacteraeota bacterium]
MPEQPPNRDELHKAMAALRQFGAHEPNGALLANRLAAYIDLMVGFASIARFREAKYTGKFAAECIEELRTGVDTGSIDETLDRCIAFINDLETKPDNIDISDRSGAITHYAEPGPEKYPVGTCVRVVNRE